MLWISKFRKISRRISTGKPAKTGKDLWFDAIFDTFLSEEYDDEFVASIRWCFPVVALNFWESGWSMMNQPNVASFAKSCESSQIIKPQ
jgi:hypothetical protein